MKDKLSGQRQLWLLLFFTLIFTADEAYSAQTVKVEIPEVIYATGDSFTLGKIARITGGNNRLRRILAGIVVYADGNTLSRNEVLAAIGESDASDARIELYMPLSSRIEPPGYEGNFTEPQTVNNSHSLSELSAIIKSLASWPGNVEVSANNAVPEGKLIDPQSITPGISGATLRFEDSRGRVKPLNVKLTWTQPAMIAAHNIKRGDRISPNDIFTREIRITRPGIYATSPAEIIGSISERNIKQGEPIEISALTSSNIIKRGRQVKIIARFGGANATVDGVLMEDGRPGDWVKVRRVDDRRTVLRARIINENTVEVKVE